MEKFSEKLIHNVTRVNIYERLNEEKEKDVTQPWITGSDFLEDGKVLLCDCEKKIVKLLTEGFNEKETLQLEDNPWDVAAFNTCDALITLPWLHKLNILHVGQSLKLGESVAKFGKKCWGVCMMDESEIYVTLHNEPGDGEVRVVDLKGGQLNDWM